MVFYQNPAAPLGQVASGAGWSVYSRGVNRINARETRGQQTWLATDMGLKLVDRARGLVTHYTRLDGLPDDRAVAVTSGADAAWAIVETRKGDSPMAALCELPHGSSHWRTARVTARPVVPMAQSPNDPNAGYSLGAPLPTAFVSVCPEKLCVALGPIRNTDKAIAVCFDRRLNTWDDIPPPPGLFTARNILSITWLSVDRDGFWLATTSGMLRYLLREKTWRRLLPDRMIYAATKTDDGALWLASYAPPAEPPTAGPPLAGGREPMGAWFATRVAPKTAATTDFALPLTGFRQPAYGMPVNPTISGISVVGKSVWLSPGARRPYNGPSPFFQLDATTGVWRAYPVQSVTDVDAIPDEALAQPTLPRVTLISAFYPWRLTEWTCRDLPDPPQDTANRVLNRDSDGSVWSTDGRTVTQTDARGTVLRRYGLGKIQVAVTPQINAVAALNGVLYATVNGDVEAFDLASETWRRMRMPRNAWSNPADDRLFPAGDRLLVGTPANVFRIDPVTQLFSTECSSQNGGFRLLGASGDSMWLRGPDNLLYRPDPATGDPEAVDPPELPAGISATYDRGQPFAYAGGLVWFKLGDKAAPQKQFVLGLDPVARSWTAGHVTPTNYPNPPTCIAAGARVYVPVVEPDASIACYDMASRSWTIAAPKAPAGKGEISLSIISADDFAFWALDNAGRCLLAFDRHAGTWSAFDLPPNVWVGQYGSESVRVGDAIYLATGGGIWRFQIATRRWTQLPGFIGRDLYLNGLMVAPADIWSIARPGNANQAFAARLTKATGQWTVWGEREGFPERAYPGSVIPNGATAWTLAGAVCFRLDPAANRWDNVSVRLARPEADRNGTPITIRPDLTGVPYLEIAEVAPDAEGAWLLPRRLASQNPATPKRPLLVRFDGRTGRYESLSPDAETSARAIGVAMQVEPDAVWVPTGDGVYRYSIPGRSWTRVDPPANAFLWGKTAAIRVAEKGVQHEKICRFYGTDTAIEWKE